MRFRLVRIAALSLSFCVFFLCGTLSAQTPSGGLRGVVTDPSGGVVANAAVLLTTPGGASPGTTTNKEGIYEFSGLASGKYTVKAVAKNFALFLRANVEITAGQVQDLNISLTIEVQKQEIQVTDSTTKVAVEPSNNAGMVVLKDKDLEALSDDPDELLAELQALAGPSAGPNGGQIYIDGFTAGQLPPKASIREIRINQNPFSAEYDKLGYGRIEIYTKPGTDQFHGQLFVTGNTTAFNSRNPFEGAAPPPSYYSTQYSGNVGGPLSKKASFFFNIERRNLNELSVIDTPFLDPTTLQITRFTGAVPNPRTRTNVSQRLDYQVTKNNTLTARYQYWRNTESGDGVGGFSLPSVAFNSFSSEHTVQVTDTQILSARVINETRFQFIHEDSNQNPLSAAPTIQIQGAFVGGGSTGGISSNVQNRYELQNITYVNFGKHAFKYGGRLRATTLEDSSNARFNGSYSFGSRLLPNCTPTPQDNCAILPLQAYQITLMGIQNNTPFPQIQAMGGGASFYSLNFNSVGAAQASINWVDGALFLQDDWRLRPKVTLSYGVRYETQNDLGDHHDFAPRLGFAWGIDGNGKNKSPNTVLRAGYGIFYDRFTADLVLQQQLQNGIIQQQYLVSNPAFFDPNQTVLPSQFQQSTTPPRTIYVPNPNLPTPYIMQTGVSLERQLTKYANLSLTYLNSRGVHQFFTSFTNANPPGTPPPSQFIYQYESGGIFKQNQFIVNSSIRMGQRLSLFGYYTLNYANSDTSGAGYILSNPFDITQDYGRASFDIRHRVFFGGSIGLPMRFRISPFMIASSGLPFNITTGQDFFGNAVYNIRPSFGTCSPGATLVKDTPYGCFNLVTQPGQNVIPINDFTGPGRFTLNLRLSKTFGFGAKKEAVPTGGPGGPGGGTFGRGPGGGPRGGGGGNRGGGLFGASPSNNRYSLTFGISARNIFNNVNALSPVGNLSSPIFGQSNGLAGQPFSSSTANRRIDLQVSFSF